MIEVGMFYLNESNIKQNNRVLLDNKLDLFCFSDLKNKTNKTLETKIRKRVYVKDKYHLELFELAKQKANVTSKQDLNKLVNSILSQGKGRKL